MAHHDDIWAEALQEAYASAPVDEMILSTLEIRHQSIDGTAIRVVLDNGERYTIDGEEFWGHFLTLEADAPIQANQSVLFQACQFSLQLPDQREGSLPTLEIELDNVTRQIMQYMDDAIGQKAPMEVSYREYLLTDKVKPHFIISGMTMKSVRTTPTKVVGSAQFSDMINRSFPGKVYRPSEFRSLRK